MSDPPIEHLVQRATDAALAALKGKKGEAETRKRIGAAIEPHIREGVRIGFDGAINAVAARRREI